jgi:hypothetical protein
VSPVGIERSAPAVWKKNKGEGDVTWMPSLGLGQVIASGYAPF